MGLLTEHYDRFKKGFLKTFNKRPVYRLTSEGVKVEYYNMHGLEELPFEPADYENSQIFLGDYANVWKPDFDAIEKEYSEFAYNDPISDLIEKRHIKPSQKYKEYMNQRVLSATFSFGGMEFEKMKYLLYIIVGIGVLNLVVMLS